MADGPREYAARYTGLGPLCPARSPKPDTCLCDGREGHAGDHACYINRKMRYTWRDGIYTGINGVYSGVPGAAPAGECPGVPGAAPAGECHCEGDYKCLACRRKAEKPAVSSTGGRDWANPAQCPTRTCRSSPVKHMCGECKKALKATGQLTPYAVSGPRCYDTSQDWTCMAKYGHEGLCVAYYSMGHSFQAVWWKKGRKPVVLAVAGSIGCCENPACKGDCKDMI